MLHDEVGDLLPELFVEFAELSNEGILICDEADQVVYCNRMARRIFDDEPTRPLIGSPVDQWLPTYKMVVYEHPQLTNKAQFVGALQCARTAHGETRAVTVQRKELRRGANQRLMLIVREYGEIQELRKKLKQQMALMDFSATPCMIQSANGDIETVNPAFEQVFGYTAAQAVGKNPNDLLAGEMTNLTEMAAASQTVLLGGSVRRDEALYRKDGSLVWIAYEQHALVDEVGHVSHIIATGTDITERHRAEQMKSDFVSMVGHELRTPLTVVSGSLEVLADKRFFNLPEAGDEIVQMARTNCDMLNALIGDLLDINKIEAGKLSLNIKAVAPGKCLDTAVQALQQQAKDREITVHAIQGDSDLYVAADPNRLVQVLINLISNAVKYGRDGGDIWLRYHQSDDKVRIEVADNGPGIDPDFRSELFSKFARDPSVAAAGIEGFGLGLSICKGLVEQMAGRIDVESEYGHGSTFFVELPQANACGKPIDHDSMQSVQEVNN